MNKAMTACSLGIMLVMYAGLAAGGSSLEISPLTLELQVDPGRSYTGAIGIENTGSESEHVRAYCQDWTLKPDGVVVFVDAGKLPNSASPWVTLSPTDLTLEAGESAQVRYTIRPPAGIAGEHRTVIIFEGGAQQVSLRGAPSRIVPRLGAILYIQCGPAQPVQARITRFAASPDGGVLVVENTGAAHLRFTGRLEIRRSGEMVRAADLGGFVVLPAPFSQHQVKIGKDSFGDLAPGEYEVTAILDCGGPSLLGARTGLIIRPAKPK